MFVANEEGSRSRAQPAPLAGAGAALPGYGRFLQADPIGYADGLNMYNYAGSDPVNGTDPSGTSCYVPSRITGCGFDGVPPPQNDGNSGGGGGSGSGGGGGTPGADGGRGSGPPTAPGTWRRFCYEDSSCSPWQQIAGPGWHLVYIPYEGDAAPDGEVTVNSPVKVSDNQKWFYAYGRYRENPNYVRPSWDIGLDGFLGLQMAAFSTAGVVAAGPVVAGRMAVSRMFGVNSSRFANSFYGGGRAGSWNRGSVRIGWSHNSKNGTLYFQPRIGNWHVPSPLSTPAF